MSASSASAVTQPARRAAVTAGGDGSGAESPTGLERRWLALGVGAVLGVYLVTRLLLLWRFPPFWDELGYADWAHSVLKDPAQRFISLSEGKEPLLSWLGAVWMKLGVDSLTAVRLVSLCSGLVTMAMIGLLARRLAGPMVAIVAAALYAVLPLFVVHDSIGLMEPLVTATAMVALYLQVRLAERPRLDFALLLGFALAAGVLTKESGRFALILIPASLLCFRWRAPGLWRRLAAWAGCIGVALLVCAGGYAVLELSSLYPRYREAQGGGLRHPIGEALAHPGRWIDQNFPPLGRGLLGYIGVPLLLALAAGVAVGLRRWPRLTGLLLAWGVFPFAAAVLIANSGFVRYALNAVAPLIVLLAVGLVAVAKAARAFWAERPAARLVAPVVVALAIAPALLLDARVLGSPGTARYPGLDDVQYATDWPAGTAWPAAVRDIERRVGSTDTFVGVDRARPLGVLLHDPHIKLVDIATPQVGMARFLLKNTTEPLPNRPELRAFRLIRRFPRPRGGLAIELYERKAPPRTAGGVG